MTAPELLPAPLIIPRERAETYLRAMDIDVEDLYAAVAAGERAAHAIDGYAPSMASGIVCWIEVVASLRRRLARTGRWGIGDRWGRPVCRHLESGRTLAIISGDMATGDAKNAFGPRAVRKKGAATAESFQPGEVLFPLSELWPRRPLGAVLAGNWVFVYHRTGAAVHMEVSQPTGFDEHAGQFTGWSVRVILDDWRPGDQKQPPLGPVCRSVDLQLFRAA